MKKKKKHEQRIIGYKSSAINNMFDVWWQQQQPEEKKIETSNNGASIVADSYDSFNVECVPKWTDQDQPNGYMDLWERARVLVELYRVYIVSYNK